MSVGESKELSSIEFPDPSAAEEDGLLCVGGRLDVPTLLTAYRQGIFPWPQPGLPLLWFSPDPRGVLFFDRFHASQSLRKRRRKGGYQATWNTAFAEVIRACAQQTRPGQRGTWITREVIHAYQRLHQVGHAHSLEIWRGEDLIGGIYGVFVAGVFSAESMFHRERDASKIALWSLVELLKARGLEWLDIQMLTPVTEAMGGQYVARADFLIHLQEAQHRHGQWDGAELCLPGPLEPART